jgi:hypothetical protein
LLLRYREDLKPSGQTVPPLPSLSSTTPTRPPNSRSNSFRRIIPLGMSSMTSSTTSPHNSAPNSPFRPSSPAFPPPSSSSSHHFHSPSPSPWNSPRPTSLALQLNATALEFKFSAGASEFRPDSAGSRSRSPATQAQQAQATWAFTSSPLGTPKYLGSPASSVKSSASYFPAHLEANSIIPRLPWAEDSSRPSSPVRSNENSYPYLNSQSHLNSNSNGGGAGGGGDNLDGGSPIPESYGAFGNQGAAWDPFETNEERVGDNYDDNDQYQDVSNDLGLGGIGAYQMTPFDVLHSVFAVRFSFSFRWLSLAFVGIRETIKTILRRICLCRRVPMSVLKCWRKL